ncbi:hypothetical protein Tco_0956448, partial [Tanacetum coccineum]
MVLQLTDFTSEITDEELREFTSEYYIPFALHSVVPARNASIADFPEGKVGLYTRCAKALEEFDMVTAQQAVLVAQLRARFSSERSQSVQKDEEILLLKTQLADAQAEVELSRSHAQKLAEEKMALLVKNNHFAGLDEFRQRVGELLEKQEDKLRKLSIEYDEELYPHMLSAIAERRWLISHGLRLAAMSALESQEVKQSFGDVVKCALSRGKVEAVEELHEKKLLT